MTLLEVKNLFEQKFSDCFDELSIISKDIENNIPLCDFKNKFLNFDKIAKKYHPNWATTDMIFFDLDRSYIVFVEYKNAKMKTDDKPKIRQKFLDSFALLYTILKENTVSKEDFWHFKTYLILVTDKIKNKGQEKYRAYLGSEDILNILESNIILYGLERYKSWYFDEIKTPFCDEFLALMKIEFNIHLKT